MPKTVAYRVELRFEELEYSRRDPVEAGFVIASQHLQPAELRKSPLRNLEFFALRPEDRVTAQKLNSLLKPNGKEPFVPSG